MNSKLKSSCLVAVFLLLILINNEAFAHRSGCHKWHSCPSNSGSYTCGDTGRCSYCSDNEYCQNGTLRNSFYKPLKQSQQRLSSSKYNRKNWPHWIDVDRDCQNTRAEILIRDSVELVKFKRNKGCNVSWGKWIGPYTGITFTKASDIDIDHIVPLSHAHKTGGANWSRSKKREFANDFENLIAVDDSTNQAKGAKSPARWKPPLKEYWCEYARRWKYIKNKYGLSLSKPETLSLGVMERTCR